MALTMAVALPGKANAVDANATPYGENVVGGSASFNRPSTGKLNVTQHTNRAIIEWQKFDIGKNASTEFAQPGKSSVAVNKVMSGGGDPTQILGTLKSNGKLVILDSNGVIFGKGSVIDVGGIVASTGNIDNNAFMNGDTRITLDGATSGSVVNEGAITVAEGGLVAFVAPHVINSGTIIAQLGKVSLAAGSKVTIDLYGDQLVEIALDGAVDSALVENSGAIIAKGGQVALSASMAKKVVDTVINMSGVIEATSFEQHDGKIVLKGGDNGTVQVAGKLDASGEGKGGKIEVRGADIQVAHSAEINADGGDQGDGGEVVVYADNLAIIDGRLSARGGRFGGNGGFIETSGLELAVTDLASIDASAAYGLSGTWLIDPLSIVLASGSGSTVTVDGRDYQKVNTTTVSSTLSGGTNVTIETGVNSSSTVLAGGLLTPDDNAGDIRVRSNITHSGAANSKLTLIADDDISIENGADITATGSGALSLDFLAKGQGVLNPGDITLSSGSVISTKGGSVDFKADRDVTIDEDITTAGGNVALKAGRDLIVNSASDNVDAGNGNISILAGDVNLNGTLKGSQVSISRSNNGRISIGDGNGGLEISQAELNRITAGTLVFGTQGTGSFDNDIIVDDANLTAFTKTILNTKRDDSGGDENVVFRDANSSGALEVHADDDIILDQYTTCSGILCFIGIGTYTDHNASLDAYGDVAFYGNTNNLSAGDLHLESGSQIRTHGNDLYSESLNTRLDGGADINAQGGDITLKNAEKFVSADSDSVHTSGTGTITIYQNAPGSIQNAINAVDNSGTGLNTIKIGAGTYAESLSVYENNFLLEGAANHGSIINPNSPGIHITGDNVTVDGLAVTDTHGADGYGIWVDNADNATIKNTLISNTTQHGIFAQGSGGLLVEDNIINNTGKDGVAVYTSNGAQIKGNEIGLLGGANNIGSTDGGDAIFVSESDGVFIQGNKTANTKYNGPARKGSGILVVKSDNAMIGGTNPGEGNDIALAGSDGIVLRTDGGSNDGNKILGNTIHGAAGSRTGIYTEFATNTEISGNTVSGSGRYAAIYGYGGNNFTINSNLVEHNDEQGIRLESAGGTNKIQYNIINDTGNDLKASDGSNSGDGIYTNNVDGLVINNNLIGLDGGAGNVNGHGIRVNGGTGHYIGVNAVQDVAQDGIEVTNASTVSVSQNTVTNAGQNGVVMTNLTGSSATYNNITGATLNGIYADNIDNSSLLYNTIKTAGSSGIVANNSDTLFVNYNYIGDDVTQGAAGNGIEASGNTTLQVIGNEVKNVDLNGIKVAGGEGANISSNLVKTTGQHGIAVSGVASSAQIMNNNVSDAAWDGINVSSAPGMMYVQDNTVDDSGDDGIDVSNVTGVDIKRNTVTDSGNNGIEATNTTNAVIGGASLADGNTVSFSGWDNVNVQGGSGAQVTYNTLNNALGASGVAVINSSGATVDHNLITAAKRLGVYLGNADGIVVSNNTISGVGTEFGSYNPIGSGISLEATDGATITGNSIDGATGDGVNIGSPINWGAGASNNTNVTVDGNTIKNVGGAGIFANTGMVSASGNVISKTGNDGIEISNSAGVQILNNKIGMNAAQVAQGANNIGGEGIDVNNSAGANISGNKITETVSNGISVNPSPNSTIENNVITNVDGHGILVNAGNNGVKVLNNKLSGVAQDGIHAESSNDLEIKLNEIKAVGSTVGGALGYGIFVSGGTSALIEDNLVRGGDGAGGNTGKKGSGLDAIHVDNNDGVEIVDNTIRGGDGKSGSGNHGGSGAGGHAIYVTKSQNASVRENDVLAGNNNGLFFPRLGGQGADLSGIYAIDNAGNSSFKNGIYIGYNVINGTGSVDSAGDDGIFVQNSGNFGSGAKAKIEGNTVDNVGEDGIDVRGTNGVQILNNDVSNTAEIGIRLNPSHNAVIDNNDVWNTGANGISVLSSNNVDVTNNRLHEIGGHGIYAENTENVDVISNTIGTGGFGVSGADLDGININGGKKAKIDGNTIQGGSFAYGAAGDGIHVANNREAVIKNNTVQSGLLFSAGALGHGIYVDNSGNQPSGIFDFGAIFRDGVQVTGNHILSNGLSLGAGLDGIHVSNSSGGAFGSNAKINNNEVRGVAGDGIFSETTHGVSVSGNTVSHTGGDSIDLENTVGAWVTGNTLSYTGNGWTDAGVEVSDSAAIHVSGNTMTAVHNGVLANDVLGLWVSNNSISGHSIYGVSVVDSAGVEVEDNSINHFMVGVNVENSNGTEVEGNEIWDISQDGIRVNNSHGSKILGNELDSIGDDGIDVANSNGVKIIGNDVDGTGGDGIQLVNGDDAFIGFNRVDDAGDDGIDIESSDDVTVYDNDISDTDNNAIEASNSDHLEVKKNDITRAGLDGIFVEFGHDINIEDNDIVGVFGLGASRDGISVQYAYDVLVQGNEINDGFHGGSVGRHGVNLYRVAGVNVDDNFIDEAGADGVHGEKLFFTRIGDNTIDDSRGDGVEILDSGKTLIVDNKVTDSGDDGIVVEDGSFHTVIVDNFVDGSGDEGIQARNVRGLRIVDNTVLHSEEDGIQVDNSGFAVVDGNYVHGAGDNGILVNRSHGAEVTGNTIAGGFFESGAGLDGIRVNGSFGTLIAGNTVRGGFFGKGARFDGIHVDGGKFTRIVDNTITNGVFASGAGQDGLRVTSSFGTLITGNVIDGAGFPLSANRHGISLDRTLGTIISDNTIDDVGSDGINVDHSAFLKISDNRISDAGSDGISIDDSFGVLIADNTIDRVNDDGIEIDDSGFVSIEGNTVNFSDDAVDIEGSGNVTVSGNTINDTDDSGVEVDDSSDIMVVDNIMTAVENGVKASSVSGLVISGNTIGGNTVTGISVFDSAGAQITGNAVDNFANGIVVEESDDALVDDNTVTNISEIGIRIGGSDGVTVSNNTVSAASGEGEGSGGIIGIQLDEVDNLLLSGNTVNDFDLGLDASGPFNGLITVEGNTFNNNTIGAWFGSGLIDLTGKKNTFNGGAIALRFIPATFGNEIPPQEGDEGSQHLKVLQSEEFGTSDLKLVDDTIGKTVFNGQSLYYIELGNGAFFEPGRPTIIDGTKATYDGVNGGLMTLAQLLAIEAMIHDYDDDTTLGQIFAGFAPGFDNEDAFRQFVQFGGFGGQAGVILNGLPFINGQNANFLAGNLNNLTPFAGDGDDEVSPEELAEALASIETAAGGDGEGQQQGGKANCWGDAGAAAGGGGPVFFQFASNPSDLLAQNASCETGSF